MATASVRPLKWAMVVLLGIIVLLLVRWVVQSRWQRHSPSVVAATFAGDLQQVEAAIRAGSDVNATEPEYSWTALHIAALRGNSSIAEMLIRNGANVGALDCFGDTPLHNAADPGLKGFSSHANQTQRNAVAEILLKNGAVPNVQALNGYTALHMAVSERNVPLIRLLLSYGADRSIPAGAGGVTPLQLSPSPDITDTLKNAMRTKPGKR